MTVFSEMSCRLVIDFEALKLNVLPTVVSIDLLQVKTVLLSFTHAEPLYPVMGTSWKKVVKLNYFFN